MNRERASDGFVWGVVATLAMSTLLLIGTATGIEPTPRPLPSAVVGLVVGEVPQAVRMLTGVAAHFAYGGMVGAAVAGTVDEVSFGHGVVLGVSLWVVMGVALLPVLGWGLFGLAMTPAIAATTLVAHLVYGGTFGWLVDREGSTTGRMDW